MQRQTGVSPPAEEYHALVNKWLHKARLRHRDFLLVRKGPEQRQFSREISVMYRRDPQVCPFLPVPGPVKVYRGLILAVSI